MDPEDLTDILNRILAVAEVVIGNNEDLVVPEMVFHHHGPRRPPGDCCDYLAVFVRSIRPSLDGEAPRFPASYIGPAKNCGDINMAVDASIAIVRNCFPTLKKDRNNPFPGEAEMQIASDMLGLYARTLWCGMIAAQQSGVLLDDDDLELAWGAMTPFRGGACAGWQWDFTLQLRPCCTESPIIPASGS